MTRLRGWAAAAVYALALAAASVLLGTRTAPVRDSWTAWASTNLDNLADHPVRALLASGVLGQDDLGWWLLFAVVGLGALGRRAGAWRAGAVAASGHVLGTLVSQGLLSWRIGHGEAAPGLRGMVDVGPSYVVAAALVAAVVVERGWWRLLPLACFLALAPHLFVDLDQLDTTAVGHTVAVITGVAGGLLCLIGRRPGTPDPLGQPAEPAGVDWGSRRPRRRGAGSSSRGRHA